MSQRARSFWGWGWADRFPDEGGLANLGHHVRGILGFATNAPRPPPELDAVRLDSIRVTPPEALWTFCTTSAVERIRHTYGRAWRDLVRGFAGDFESAPDVVARPRTEAEIEAVYDWAARDRVAVVPYGGGTSVVGGVECARRDGHTGVVSLDMGAFDKVLEVDAVSRAARIQAGCLGPALEEALGRDGLTLRHFPQSFEFSTFGGWLATRAGGHFATLYTHIDDLVESVRMVTPAGLGSGVGGSLRQRPAPGPAGRCCRWTLCRTILLMSPTRWQNAFYVYYARTADYGRRSESRVEVSTPDPSTAVAALLTKLTGEGIEHGRD